MTRDELQTLFSTPPASFTWSQSEDGWRIIGASTGCVLDLWSDRAEMVATFPPDSPELAQRNAALMMLLLTALRPDWQSGGDWLAVQMRSAARSRSGQVDAPNVSRRVRFQYDRQRSRATLVVRM